jgi:hypothetical protein
MTDQLFDRLERLLGATHELRRELAGGGMSRVFVAHETALKRDVVVKVLPPELISDASAERFAREVELTARLQHPHILPVLSAGGDGDLLYYFTPYVPGESLRARLATGTMAVDEAVQLTAEVLDALAAAHAHGVVHRDVKPGNVLVSGHHAILADFGIARALGVAGEVAAEASTLAGARAYMAPERERGPAADLFSVAVMAHEMLLGAPGAAGVDAAKVGAALDRRHRHLGAARSRALGALLAAGLASDPAKRPASAAEFRRRLLDAAAPVTRPARVIAAVSAAAVIVVASLVAFQSGARPDTASQAAAPNGPRSPADSAGVTPDSGAAFASVSAAAGTRDTTAAPPARGPRSLADSAADAYDHWQIGVALAAFDSLERRSPGNPEIALRIATARMWSSDPAGVEAMKGAAARALAVRERLKPAEVALAEAILALGEARYPDACAGFERARRAGANAFDVALGAGDCRSLDERVLPPDSTGPARFRSSYAEAFRAYVAAIHAAPGGAPSFAFRRLDRVMFIQMNRVRRGQSADGRTWFARPEASGDSLTFRPFDPRERRGPSDPAADAAALAAARAALHPLFIEWVRSAPSVATSHEALSDLLEAEGHIRTGGVDGLTALSENLKARALQPDSVDKLRLDRDRVRLFLRAAEWEAAGRLADSMVRTNTNRADPRSAIYLAAPAALAGRVHDAARLAALTSARPDRAIRLSDGRVADLPPAVLRDRAEFAVRSALGVCDDQLRDAPRRIREQVDAFLPAGGRTPQLDQALFDRPVGANLECFGLQVAASVGPAITPPMRAAQALARGDTAMATGMLDAMDRQRAASPGAPDNIELLAPDLAVRRLLGRRADAARLAARFFDLLPAAPSQISEQETWAALIGRTLVDLADDAKATGDATTARRWAAAAAALWKNADPELQPVVARMRAIANP